MITKLLNTLSLFFGVSKSEVRGMILLLLFCIVMLIIPFVQRATYASQSHTFNVVVDTTTIAAAASETAGVPYYSQNKEGAPLKVLRALNRPVPIHAITSMQLDSLGLQKRLVRNISKYLEKGGRFRKPEDLNKIYGMDAQSAAHIATNTLWDKPLTPNSSSSSNNFVPIPKPSEKLDINTVDTVTLEGLKGIGHILAQRIIKYRDKLGGFVSLEQLREVYGISDFALSEINQNTYVRENFKPKLLKINHIKLEELSAHPYIGYKKSKVVFNYLKNHSKLADFEDFRKAYPFTDKELGFIKYYISYE